MKTTFAYDHYYLHEEIKKDLEHFARQYPDLCEVQTICVTEKGLEEYAVILTNQKTGKDISKPALYVDGNIHAGEVTASMVCMYLIDYLLTNYGSDPNITKLLDTEALYVLPRISPDGAEAYLSTPAFMYSADRDWKEVEGGISPEDIDKDGVIRMMRFKDPYGVWKLDPEDPDRLLPRQPDEREGDFYSCYPEGEFQPYDDQVNLKQRKMHWGMNFNRNFPFGWYPDGREPGAGEYPLSFPEVKAQAQFILAHPNIGGVAAMHTTAGMILYPPGTMSESKADPGDMKLFKEIGAMGTQETGYPTVNIFDAFLADTENYSSGALDDWCYETMGIPAYTVELWDLANKVGMPEDMTARISGELDIKVDRFSAYVKWIKEHCPEAWHPWSEFDHPVLGKVEIGGYNYKFTQQNPPGDMLCEVCENIARFMIRFAKALPKIEITKLEAKKLYDNTYEVCCVIGNNAYLSTNLTNKAFKMKCAEPVKVRIEGATLLSGKEITEIESLEGYSQAATRVFYGEVVDSHSAKSRKELKWIVKAEEKSCIKVSVSQIKAGEAEKEICL